MKKEEFEAYYDEAIRDVDDDMECLQEKIRRKEAHRRVLEAAREAYLKADKLNDELERQQSETDDLEQQLEQKDAEIAELRQRLLESENQQLQVAQRQLQSEKQQSATADKLEIMHVSPAEATAIRTVNTDNNTSVDMYDMQGRRVTNTHRGIVIQNGTKYAK